MIKWSVLRNVAAERERERENSWVGAIGYRTMTSKNVNVNLQDYVMSQHTGLRAYRNPQ
jgi:hypothetical protein